MGPLIRWEPTTGLSRFRDEINRLLEDFFGETTEERVPANIMRVPSVDVIDQGNEILVRAEMPGIDKNNIQIEAAQQGLTIRAEIKKEEEEQKESFIRKERRMGFFQRIIPLPVEIKPNEVKATYKDGVLEVKLPKSEQAKSRQPVKVNVE